MPPASDDDVFTEWRINKGSIQAISDYTGAGDDPVEPALMAMALLLQSYHGVSDHEAVELTVVDLRWQMVLDRLGSDKAAFAQSTFVDFRDRLIRTDMDRRLLCIGQTSCMPPRRPEYHRRPGLRLIRSDL